MRQSIRALGWATTALWVLMIVFVVTTVYSGVGFLQGSRFSVVKSYVKGEAIITETLISVKNTGFYDIHNFNITTYTEDPMGNIVSKPSTSIISFIMRGSTLNSTHQSVLNFSEMVSRRLYHLIFNDTVLNQFWSISAKIARIMPVSIRVNSTIDWKAPLGNFSVSEPLFEADTAAVILSFENHSPFNVTIPVTLELYNGAGTLLGSTTIPMYDTPGDHRREVTLTIDSSKVTSTGFVRVHFLNFDYEERFPYG